MKCDVQDCNEISVYHCPMHEHYKCEKHLGKICFELFPDTIRPTAGLDYVQS